MHSWQLPAVQCPPSRRAGLIGDKTVSLASTESEHAAAGLHHPVHPMFGRSRAELTWWGRHCCMLASTKSHHSTAWREVSSGIAGPYQGLTDGIHIVCQACALPEGCAQVHPAQCCVSAMLHLHLLSGCGAQAADTAPHQCSPARPPCWLAAPRWGAKVRVTGCIC